MFGKKFWEAVVRLGFFGLLAGWAFDKISTNYFWLSDSLTWLVGLPDKQGIGCQYVFGW